MIYEKIARICWNTNYWKKPSGPKGKSKNKKSYEYINGYGHEEWLFDTEKTIDGYHYAYLQAIGANYGSYIGKVFNISVYSIDNQTKERWWIGEIINATIIEENESNKVYSIYKKNNWLKEMETQLDGVDANVDSFKSTPSKNFVNIKFRPEELQLLDEPRQFSKKDDAIKSDYYNLKNKTQTPKLLIGSFLFTCGHNEKKHSTIRTYNKSEQKGDLIHNKIQNEIYKQLCCEHGESNVGTEIDDGFGSRIDIVLKSKNNKYIFFEIKTSRTVKQCIREALTQLMEYSFFPNRKIASELVIISPNKIDDDNKTYLDHIRKKFGIPVSYQRFNRSTNKLEDA